jgi:hypothetical protein
MAASQVGRTRPRIDLAAFIRLTELADYFVPFTIRAICELGVADKLADGPRTVEELAAATGAHAPSLLRALRALACKGIFTEVEPGTFDLTEPAQLLRGDHPLSLRDAYHLMPADIAAWAQLGHSLRTGEPAFDHVHGQRLWDYLGEHPEDGERFDRGMQAMTRPELRVLLTAYPWAALGTVVDVGGGNGAFLAGLLARHRSLRGVLFDLPHVVAGAAPVLAEAGVEDRCEIVAGSFFEDVPPGADAYVLKRIVYGWDDEGALALLRAVRAAMSPGSRILVFEPVVAPGNDNDFGKILDVVMLVVDGGRARTAGELGELFDAAGLELERVVPTWAFSIVEGRAR